MADAVTSNVIANTPKEYVIHLTCISDGTGETNVIKVDKSTLLDVNNVEPAALDFERIRWNVQGFSSVVLKWDHTTDDTALVCGEGSGYDDFTGAGTTSDEQGLRDFTRTSGLQDPLSAGGTGDILLTSNGAAAGATYDITIWLHKRAA